MNPAAIFNPQPQQIGSVLIGADQFVANFVSTRTGSQFSGPLTGMGVIRKGVFVGGVVYHNYLTRPHGSMIELSFAFDSPSWALPETLKTLAEYPFVTAGCCRVNAIIAKANKRARQMAEFMGFAREGVHPKAYDGKQTAISYGLLRENCRFLRDTNGR